MVKGVDMVDGANEADVSQNIFWRRLASHLSFHCATRQAVCQFEYADVPERPI